MDTAQAREYIERLDALAEHRSVPFSPGRTLRWRIFGKGEPLVLLHGGHGSWLHWIRNIEALSRDRSVVVADLPGYGDSDDLPPGANMQTVVDAVVTALDALFGERYTIDLAGFSYGGVVSARIAAQRGNVRRLALLGSPGSATAQRPRARLIRWRDAEGAAQDAALRHNLLAHMLFDETSADALAFKAYVDALKAARFRGRALAGAVPLEEILAAFSNPTLFIWGEHDVTATPALIKDSLTAAMPNRALRIVSRGGHWIQFECADEVNAELMRWFSVRMPGSRSYRDCE